MKWINDPVAPIGWIKDRERIRLALPNCEGLRSFSHRPAIFHALSFIIITIICYKQIIDPTYVNHVGRVARIVLVDVQRTKCYLGRRVKHRNNRVFRLCPLLLKSSEFHTINFVMLGDCNRDQPSHYRLQSRML